MAPAALSRESMVRQASRNLKTHRLGKTFAIRQSTRSSRSGYESESPISGVETNCAPNTENP